MCNLELFSKTSYIYNIEVYHVFLSCRVGLGVAISLTATNLINDRQSGLFDRSYAAGTMCYEAIQFITCHCAGVNAIEVIISQMVAYGTITCAQAILLVVSGVYIIDVSVCNT